MEAGSVISIAPLAQDWAISIDCEVKSLADQGRLSKFVKRTIFRVPNQVKEIKKEHFVPDLMYIGLLNKYRFSTFRNHGQTSADYFRLVMVNAFIQIVNDKRKKEKEGETDIEKEQKDDSKEWNWEKLIKHVVTQEKTEEIKGFYDEVEPPQSESEKKFDKQYCTVKYPVSKAVIRRALTLDAIFLACYLGAYLYREEYPSEFPYRMLHDIVSSWGISFHNRLLNDITKLENQIPLSLMQTVLAILPTDEQADDGAALLTKICHKWAKTMAAMLPGFSRSARAGSSGGSYQFQSDHLLGCLCEVMRLDQVQPSIPPTLLWTEVQRLFRWLLKKAVPPPFHHILLCKAILRLWKAIEGLWKAIEGLWNAIEGLWNAIEGNALKLRKAIKWLLKTIFSWSSWVWDLVCLTRESSSAEHNDQDSDTMISLPSATKLRDAGISFRGKADGVVGVSTDLLPVFKPKFHRLSAVVIIPSFPIEQRTELLWRNMVTYEYECQTLKESKPESMQFIHFLKFMDEMINTKQDVTLLRKTNPQVINKMMLGTNHDVAVLFNSIVQHHIMDDSQAHEWKELRRQIHSFTTNRYRSGLLEFVMYSCGKPWLVVSLLAATILMVLTFLQTLYTMLAFYSS